MNHFLPISPLLVLVAFSNPAFALFHSDSEGQSCEELQELFYHQDKVSALIAAKEMTNDSEIRATNSHLKQLKALQNKQIILKFMDKQKCTYPRTVENNYLIRAVECSLEESRAYSQSLTDNSQYVSPPECDRSKW